MTIISSKQDDLPRYILVKVILPSSGDVFVQPQSATEVDTDSSGPHARIVHEPLVLEKLIIERPLIQYVSNSPIVRVSYEYFSSISDSRKLLPAFRRKWAGRAALSNGPL